MKEYFKEVFKEFYKLVCDEMLMQVFKGFMWGLGFSAAFLGMLLSC